MSKIAPHGPFTMEVTFHYINNDGDTSTALFDVPAGEVPPILGLQIICECGLEELAKLGPGWRPMTRHEFQCHQQADKLGIDVGRINIPSAQDDFDFTWPQ